MAAWLKAGRAVTTRRARLADVAAFLRWLDAELPGVGLLAVTEDHLTHYRDGIGTGTARAGLGRPGVALAPATVARRLSSLYGYALRRRLLTVNPADPVERPEVFTVGTTPAAPWRRPPPWSTAPKPSPPPTRPTPPPWR